MNETERLRVEVDKRLSAALDLIQWVDQRIATQVEHQLKQRLAQEREYWRCNVSDLIAEERERVSAHIADERRNLLGQVKQEIIGFALKDHEHLEQLVAKVDATVERMFDRMTALVKGAGRRSDNDVPAAK